MFSSKLARAANHAAAPTASAIPRTSACLAHRPSHQRRPSSSKASCPPDSDKPAPAAKAVAGTSTTPAAATASSEPVEVTAAPTSPPRRSKRNPIRRIHGASLVTKEKATAMQQHPVLPSVPRVDHLNEKDVGLSSFFSLHRPISVTHTIPPPATTDAFNALFASPSQSRDQWADGDSAQGRPEDVIYTLHNTIEALEAGTSAAEENGVRWEVLQESPSNADGGVRHLDGSPPRAKTLDELVATFRPFHAPPPPQSFLATPTKTLPTARTKKVAASTMNAEPAAPRTKSYQTTITVHEVTDPKGRKSYSASSSPIISVPTTPSAPTILTSLTASGRTAFNRHLPVTSPLHALHARYPAGPQQPFRQRLQRREKMYLANHPEKAIMDECSVRDRAVRRAPTVGGKVKYFVISVKRQRKLKMKKHKYKKLMKRTRNLRRRLDRN